MHLAPYLSHIVVSLKEIVYDKRTIQLGMSHYRRKRRFFAGVVFVKFFREKYVV